MGIKINSNFTVQAPLALDERQVLTFEQMRSINDAIMPDVYFAVCSNDNKIYVYNKENDDDSVTGKFRIAEASSNSVFRTMPGTSEFEDGFIIQYVGDTTSYTFEDGTEDMDVAEQGYFYKVDGTKWVQINVQPTNYVLQLEEFPEEEELTFEYGKIIQYIGSDEQEYNNGNDGESVIIAKTGHFYRFNGNSVTPRWEEVSTNTIPKSILALDHVPDSNETEEQGYSEGTIIIIDNYDYDSTGNNSLSGELYQLVGDEWKRVVTASYYEDGLEILQLRDMPEADQFVQDISSVKIKNNFGEDYNNMVVLYIGDSNADNTNSRFKAGQFYKIRLNEETGKYEWYAINLNHIFTKYDDEYVLCDYEVGEIVQYLGTPEQDDNTIILPGTLFKIIEETNDYDNTYEKKLALVNDTAIVTEPTSAKILNNKMYYIGPTDTDNNLIHGSLYIKKWVQTDFDTTEPYWERSNSEQSSVQLSVMPTVTGAGSPIFDLRYNTFVGAIIQYIGETNDEFVKGYFYECVEEYDEEHNIIYNWKRVDTQPDFVSIHVEEMPDPADYQVGSVIQNLDATDPKYTRGYFYENVKRNYTTYTSSNAEGTYYVYSATKGSSVFVKDSEEGDYEKFSTIRDVSDGNLILNAENASGDRIVLDVAGESKEIQEWVQLDIQPDFTSIHVLEMPTANADKDGEVVQYLGTNTDDYTRGYFYECAKVDGVWKWVNIKTQADFVSIHVEEMPNADDYEIGYVVQNLDATDPNYTRGFFYECVADEENVGHNKWKQLDTQPDFVSIHVEEMPVANADRLGEVLQYLGESDDTYTKGFFYECKNVAPAPEGDEEVEPEYKWVELRTISKEKSFQVTELDPNVSGGGTGDYSVGDIVQYIGPNTDDVKTGHFYQVANLDVPPAIYYGWKEVDVQTTMHVTELPDIERSHERIIQYLGEDTTFEYSYYSENRSVDIIKGRFYECRNINPDPRYPIYAWIELQTQSDANCTYSSEDTNIDLNNLKDISAEDMADMDFHKFMQIINYAKSEIKLEAQKTVVLRGNDESVTFFISIIDKSSPVVDSSVKYLDAADNTEVSSTVIPSKTMTVYVAAELEDGKEIKSNSVTINVVGPIMYGSWDENYNDQLPNAVADQCASDVVAPTKTYKVTFTSNNQKLIIALPTVDYPDGIKKILDPNGFDNTSSFELVTTEEIATRSGTHEFAVYVSKTPVTCSDFTYTISL